jgi:glycosyltransferase involved in cell wall biosynthesis
MTSTTEPLLSFVLPVHNNADIVEPNVETLSARLARAPGSDIFLVENGSRDASWDACEAVRGTRHGVEVRPYRESQAGLGYAYARGIDELLAVHGPSTSRWAVLTATDLPFAFTDLDRALPYMKRGVRAIAGSKAHAASQAWAGAQRYVMSIAYRNARRAILGMSIGDSQGSFFLRLDLLAATAPFVRARDFFYTTELAYLIEREGEVVTEVPVVLEQHQLVPANSSVRPLTHASRMLKQLVELRRRVPGRAGSGSDR